MRSAAVCHLAILFAASAVSAQDEQSIRKTLTYLPETINTVAVVRVKDVLKSPRGRAEQWEKNKPGQFLAGGLDVNAAVNHVVRGLEFHPEDSHLSQSVGVVAFEKPVSMSQLAKQENGEVEKIAGKQAVHSPQRGFFVALEPNVIGNMQPSYRQNVGRWLRSAVERVNPPAQSAGNAALASPYLRDAVRSEDHVVLAMDLADAVDPHMLRRRLKNFSLVANDDKQQESLAKLLEHLRGIRLLLNVTEDINARIAIDFDTKPAPKLADYIRPLLIEVLDRAGASLDELEIATSKVEDKSVVLSMKLSDSSARHVLSLAFSSSMDLPSEETPSPGIPGESDEKRKLAATRNYLSAVNRLIDDLQEKSQRSRNYQRTVAFHESYARKIDQLSVRDVDTDVLKYAAGVSSNLRALAVSLRGVPLTVNRLEHSITWDLQYQPWAFGFNVWGGIGFQPEMWNFNTNQGQIIAQQAEAIARGEESRNEVWRMIADDRQQIRLKLREKYNEDFE